MQRNTLFFFSSLPNCCCRLQISPNKGYLIWSCLIIIIVVICICQNNCSVKNNILVGNLSVMNGWNVMWQRVLLMTKPYCKLYHDIHIVGYKKKRCHEVTKNTVAIPALHSKGWALRGRSELKGRMSAMAPRCDYVTSSICYGHQNCVAEWKLERLCHSTHFPFFLCSKVTDRT